MKNVNRTNNANISLFSFSFFFLSFFEIEIEIHPADKIYVFVGGNVVNRCGVTKVINK